MATPDKILTVTDRTQEERTVPYGYDMIVCCVIIYAVGLYLIFAEEPSDD